MRSLIILLLILAGFTAQGQGYYCKDSLNVDTYYQCGRNGAEDFDPVCGCDFVTYRNACAAEHWGGLYFNSWTTENVCGNFAFDFRPTALSYISTDNHPARIQLFIKNLNNVNIPVNVYVYDVYGKLWYTWTAATSLHGKFPLEPNELPLQSLQMGIYVLIVVVNNEKQSLKFGKITNE